MSTLLLMVLFLFVLLIVFMIIVVTLEVDSAHPIPSPTHDLSWYGDHVNPRPDSLH